jgi:hypothetical protein
VLLRLLPAQLCILAGVDTSGYLVQQYAQRTLERLPIGCGWLAAWKRRGCRESIPGAVRLVILKKS